MRRQHAEIRQAAILIYPVVKEPAEVPLRCRRNQPLHVFWVLVVRGPIVVDGLLERVFADHVAQHPPDIRGLAAVIALIESGRQRLAGNFFRRSGDVLLGFDKGRSM